MWFSRRERRAQERRGQRRRGVFGGEIKTKEEIDQLVENIESHEEIEKKKADEELEAEWEKVEGVKKVD